MALEDKDIDSKMAADWAAIQEKHAVEEPDPAPAPELEAPAEEPATEPVAEEARPRREDGTFAPKAQESVKVAEPVDKNPPPEPVLGAKGAPIDINQAPSTWKPVARAEFAKLPEAVRAEIHRRESDALNGQAQLLPDARLGKSVTEIMAPYQAMIQAEGGTPERAIADLMRTAALFRTGSQQAKQQALIQIAQQFNIPLPNGQTTQQPQQQFQDPRVDQLLQHLQTQEQQRQQVEQQQLLDSVSRWVDQKDETGAPKYPYLNDVQGEMAVLVPMIRQSNPSFSHEQVLQSAYDRAIWANPDVKPVLLAAQAAEAARTPANQDRVREAKRAASVNVPRRASSPAAGKPGRMEDTIAETARTLGLIT